MTRFLIIYILAGFFGAYLAIRKGRNPVLWGLAVFLFPLALIILAILPTSGPGTMVRKCSGCGRPLKEGLSVCSYCNMENPIEMVECPHCHTVVPRNRRCSQCKGVL